jgi:hypothetical protein
MRDLLYYAFVVWPRRTFLFAIEVLTRYFDLRIPAKPTPAPVPEPTGRIIIDVTDDKNVKYTLDKDVTPENVATVAMNFALFADLRFLINELERNGHKDVEFRLGREASSYIEKLMGNMTNPDSNTASIGDDKSGVKVTMMNSNTKNKDDDKPLIEPLAFHSKG